MNKNRWQLHPVLEQADSGSKCRSLALFAAFFSRRLHKRRIATLVIALTAFLPCALAQGDAQPAASTGTQAQSELFINDWQGAKNYSESFPIKVKGGSTSGQIRFLCGNCTVSPATGTKNDTYTVTVTGSGTYSLTAIMAGDSRYAEVSDSKRGVGGKADQAPLFIEGWGTAKSYYRTFPIKVTGGTLRSTVTFETDGCSVSPATGPVGSQFTVTVTRVGAYTLTALMDGDEDYNKAYSAQQSGVACKSSQSPIVIAGWKENARYGDTFTLDISGGLSSEVLRVKGEGCAVTHIGGRAYEVAVNTVGPYSVTASRAGNYGYYPVSAYVSGISRQAEQPGVSISGWSESKNAGDTFIIRIRGGVSDGTVHFLTTGCTVTPLTGTVDTDYFVTVSSVGPYTLMAYVDGTANYVGANSRELKGCAEKALQPKINVDHWVENAVTGSSFDVELIGGKGTGATSVTTYGGCSAVLKNSGGNSNVYTVTVTAGGGEPYGLRISKQGDANYFNAVEETLNGVAASADQSVALSVNGWKDKAQAGEAFAIHLENDGGADVVNFETIGCTIDPPNGAIDDIYTVTVTAEAGDSYSLSIKQESDGGLGQTSVRKNGSVRPAVRLEQDTQAQSETPMLGNNFDVWLLMGMIAVLVVLLSLAMFLQYREHRYRRRRHR